MAVAFPVANRPAGDYPSPDAPVNKLKNHDVQISPQGISAADLADPTFQIVQNVEANDTPADETKWYTVYGPNTWYGGGLAHDGTPFQPGFVFHNSGIPDSAVRLRLRVTTNKTATWGFNVTVL